METQAFAHYRQIPGAAAALTGLMALYESNYRRLQRLLPERDFSLDAAVSRVAGPLAGLHLRIVGHSPYTQTLHLSHRITAGSCALQVPDQWLRVYHDAGLVEALPAGNRPEPPHAALSLRQARNRRLNDWLGYWLAQGHGFVHLGRPRRT